MLKADLERIREGIGHNTGYFLHVEIVMILAGFWLEITTRRKTWVVEFSAWTIASSISIGVLPSPMIAKPVEQV